jgi:sec-independent protein translocase protein TatC
VSAAAPQKILPPGAPERGAARRKSPDDSQDVSMPFVEHLRELRTRIFHSVIGISVGFCVAYYYAQKLFSWLMLPLRFAIRALQAQGKLKGADPAALAFKSPIEPFFTYLQVGLIGGLMIAAPWVLYQLWKFIAPALYRKEKTIAVPFVVSGVVFFMTGVYFCWAVVLPYGFEYLIDFGLGDPSLPVHAMPQIMMKEYFDLASRMLLAFGLIFEFPVVIAFMAWMGLVTHKTLLHVQRYAIVILAIIAAVLTPPDPVTMMLMLVPLVALYYASVVVAFFFSRRRARAAAAAGGAEEGDDDGAPADTSA